MTGPAPALVATDVQVTFERSATPTVQGASFTVERGQTLAIVGRSGSGKSTLCRAALGLLPPATTVAGSITLGGQELVGLAERAMRQHRGSGIAMVLQNPDRSLNPTMRIGEQLAEAITAVTALPRGEASTRALELVDQVELSNAARILRSYPYELSGGMRQRVSIAIALANRPIVLVADEPTSALDAPTQAAIVRMLTTVQHESGLAVVLVTHDLSLAESCAQDVMIMREGRLAPGHTRARAEGTDTRPPRHPQRPPRVVLEVRDLVQVFGSDGHPVRALAGVTLDVRRGETVGLVGGSGCGKSTLAHAILHAPTPTGGDVRIDGSSLSGLDAAGRRARLRDVHLVPQHPFGSIDPTWRLWNVVAEPLASSGNADRRSRRARANEMLELVGLDPAVWGRRRRRELSGGQAQQVAIARALVNRPSLVILDEPVSSLDPVTTSRILTLLAGLQGELGLSYLFIAHDLSAVQRSSDRVAVMYRGRICETGPTTEVLRRPRHPYTAALNGNDHASTGRGHTTAGDVTPFAKAPISGCAFQDQCPRAAQICREVDPPMQTLGPDHDVACHFPLTAART